MDSNAGGVLGIFGFLISAAGIVYTAINHKRLRCKCCGKDMDISVDVEPTTPKDVEKEEEEVKPVEKVRRSSLTKTGATAIDKYTRR